MQDQDTSQFEPAGMSDYFRKAFQIIRLDQSAMLEVAQDRNALRFGIPVTAIGGALAFLPGEDLTALLVGALFSLVVLVFLAAFVHLLCGYTKSKQEFLGFVRIIAVAGILDWAVVIPYTGVFITVWSVAIAIAAAREVYYLTRAKAIFTVLISVIMLWMMTLIIFTGPLSSYLVKIAE